MILSILETANCSIKDAAKLLGVSRVTLSKIINGRSPLTPKLAQRFEEVFGVSKENLLAKQNMQLESKTVSPYCSASPFFEIHSTDIENWVNHEKLESRAKLPQLIRFLITTTSNQISEINFPANDESQRHGFDGYVCNNGMHCFIPSGISYWEMGTSENCEDKFKSDLSNSAKKASEDVQKNSTLVFVTPRSWEKSADCLKKHKSDYKWKDIKIIDASILEQWIECSLPTQIWFMEQIEKETNGLETLSMCWNRWLKPINEESFPNQLFDELIQEYSEVLNSFLHKKTSKDRVLTIRADSVEEACAYLYLSLQAKELRNLCVYFSNMESTQKISVLPSNVIAITSDENIKKELLERGNTLVIWIETKYRPDIDYDIDLDPIIDLHPISHNKFETTYESTGIDSATLAQLEKSSNGSLTALRRTLAPKNYGLVPSWANDEETAHLLIPFLFAGTWNNSEGYLDKIIISELLTNPVNDLDRNINKALDLKDTPLWKEPLVSGVKSKRDLFLLLKRWITPSDYKRFFETLVSVFKTTHEAQSDFSPKVSTYLKRNLADTLFLIARSADTISACSAVDTKKKAEQTVKTILNAWNFEDFKEYGDVLVYFALAAPEAFLGYFGSHKDMCKKLMEPVENVLLDKAPRIELSHALHNLCWEESTFKDAVQVLSILAKDEPANSKIEEPSNILQLIFSAYFIRSGVSTQKRVEHLKKLSKEFPEVFWDICLWDIASTYHSAPEYLPPSELRLKSFSSIASKAEIRAMLQVKKDLLFSKNFTLTTNHLVDLVTIYEKVDEKEKKQIIESTKKWAKTASISDKQKVVLRLEARVQYFKNNMDGESITSDDIHKLETLIKILGPNTEIEARFSIFGNQAFHHFYNKTENKKEALRNLAKKRKKALQEIKKEEGLAGILRLLETVRVEPTQGVASLCSEILPDTKITNLVLMVKKEINDHKRLRNILTGLLFSPHEKVLLSLLKRLKGKEFLSLVLDVPPGVVLTNFISKNLRDYEKAYWENLNTLNFPCENVESVILVCEKLLSAKRANEAFSYGGLYLDTMPSTLISRILKEMSTKDTRSYIDFDCDIEAALKNVCNSPKISLFDKALLEIKFAKFLQHSINLSNYKLTSLTDYILKNPHFFVELIESVTEDDSQKIQNLFGDTEEYDRERIQIALDLLSLDDQSTEMEKTIDYMQWAKEVIDLAEQKNIRVQTDYYLGRILARHNKNRFNEENAFSKEVWFHAKYSEIIEKLGSEDMLRGFYFGQIDSIGVRFSSLNGDSERAIAKIFERDVSKAEGFPKVQSVFLDLKNDCEEDGEKEDKRIRRRTRSRFFLNENRFYL